MITFTCPRCKKVHELPEDKAGTKLPCSECGQRLLVPDPGFDKTMPAHMIQALVASASQIAIKPASQKAETVRPVNEPATWYYRHEGQQMGPVSWGQLQHWARQGALQPGEAVWNQGMTSWTRAALVPGLFPATGSNSQVTLAPAASSPAATSWKGADQPARSFGKAAWCFLLVGLLTLGVGGGVGWFVLKGKQPGGAAPQKAPQDSVNAGRVSATADRQPQVKPDQEQVVRPSPAPAKVAEKPALLATPAAGQTDAQRSVYQKTLECTAYILAGKSSGSGFVVDRAQRLVVSARHVVGASDTVEVIFPAYRDDRVVPESKYYRESAKRISGRVISTDLKRDLALIQLAELPLDVKQLAFGTGSEPGERVHSIGNPGASDALWVYTSGTTRQVYRKTLRYNGLEVVARVIETQSPINAGDSGGPLVNDQGQLIGMMVARRIGAELMNFAVEVSEIRTFVTATRELVAPHVAADYRVRADGHRLQGRLTSALADYEEALRQSPEDPLTLLGRGRLFLRRNEPDKAVTDFSEALRLLPTLAAAYAERGQAYENKKDLHRAIADYSEALRLKPADSDLYRRRGNAFDQRNDSLTAVTDYTEAIRLDPKNFTAYVGRGIAYRKQKELDKAIADYDVALRLDPNSGLVHNNRGFAYFSKGEHDKALADYSRALELTPNHTLALGNRARLYAERGEQDKAVQDYTALLKINPKDSFAYQNRSRALTKLGRDAQAKADQAEALRLNPALAKAAEKPATKPTGVANATPVKPEAPVLEIDAQGHTSRVTRLLFTPDGKQLISISFDKVVRIWDVASGEPLRVLHPPIGGGYLGKLYAAALSPDGKTLAIGGLGGKNDPKAPNPVFLISLENGRILRTLDGTIGILNSLAFSPDGTLLACAGNGLKLFRVMDPSVPRELQGHEGRILCLAFSKDGRLLASGASDKTLRLWSIPEGKTIATFSGHEQSVMGIAWAPGDEALVSASSDQSVRLWSRRGELLRKLSVTSGTFSCISFAPDGRKILVGGVRGNHQGFATILQFPECREIVSFQHNNTVMDGRFSPDGTLVASTGGDNDEICLWRSADGKQLHRLESRGRAPYAAGWSRDGTHIAWGETNKGATWQHAAPLQRTFDLTKLQFGDKPDASCQRGVLRSNGLELEHKDRTEVVYKEGGKQIAYSDFKTTVFCATILKDGRAAIAADDRIYLTDPRTGKTLRTFFEHTSEIFALAPSPDGRFLLSAGTDQTLRVWDLKQDRLLLSLFITATDWVAWTPTGYYAASAGGEQLIGWHVNHGWDHDADYYPAAQFRQTLFRPDVVKRLLELGSLEQALAATDKQRGSRSERTEVAQILPPKAVIVSPSQSGQRVTASSIEVRVQAESSGEHPITQLRLLLNGRPIQEHLIESPQLGRVAHSWQVDLPPGTHRLAVQAGSAVSRGVSPEVEVTFAPAGTTTLVSKSKSSGSLYLLAIGINAYSGRMKLDAAVPDARLIEKTFRQNGDLFQKVETKLLLDEQATRRNIIAGLDWLAKQSKPGDVTVMFYAGHGDSKLADQFHLLPVDVDIKNLPGTGISRELLRSKLGGLPSSTLLLMDACFSGSFDQRSQKKKRSLPTGADELVRDLVYDDGLVVMCAAAKEQEATEERGHGYFTTALTEALSGKGGKDRFGLVTLYKLQAYVRDRVLELSNDEQEPTISIPSTVRSFALAKP